MALVHDLAESIVGDIAPADNVSKEEKHRREKVQWFVNVTLKIEMFLFVYN